jgi:hypothetical protein
MKQRATHESITYTHSIPALLCSSERYSENFMVSETISQQSIVILLIHYLPYAADLMRVSNIIADSANTHSMPEQMS